LGYRRIGAGARTLASFGLNVTEVWRSRRHFAGECIDWTQRRGHLNGALAAAITARLFELDWITRGARRRGVLITAAGAQGLADTFGQCWPRGDELSMRADVGSYRSCEKSW
jgi:hypothetical protein